MLLYIISKPRHKQQTPTEIQGKDRKSSKNIVNIDNFDRSGASECFLTRFDKCCLRRSGAAARWGLGNERVFEGCQKCHFGCSPKPILHLVLESWL